MSRLSAGILAGGGVPGNDAFTKILLHMDGANGGTTFTDSNAGGVLATWSTSGSPTTTTAAQKFGTASYQGGANSHIVSSQVTPYQAGSSDFTVDFWMRGDPSNAAVNQGLASFLDSAQTTFSAGWSLFYSSSKVLTATFGNTGFSGYQTNTGVTTIMDGNWHHIEWVKRSTSSQIYIDGVATGTPITPSGSLYANSSQRMWVGAIPSSSSNISHRGQIDEFRYSVGIDRHTANFTPPTGPYT